MPTPSRAAKAAPARSALRPQQQAAILLGVPEQGVWEYHTNTHRVVTQIRSSDRATCVRLQTPFRPNGTHETLGVWYGCITRFDADGRAWERSIDAVVDNFGDLVEVPR